MTPSSDSDERDKPSWREIDRRRDRSRHASRDDRSTKEKYLKEVDKFFTGKKGGKEHKTALDAIHRSYGTSKFASSVQKYLQKYGIPDDWSTLMLLLDYKDDDVLAQVIETMRTLVPERSTMERHGFKDKLEILSLTASSSQTISLIENIIKEL
jgi:hypothetical protein